MMRNVLVLAAHIGRGFCGALLVYLVVCNAIADPLATSYPARMACMPFHSVFGLLETECDDPFLWTFWFLSADIPRFVIVPPALAIAMLKAFAHNFGCDSAWHYFLESLPWFAMSIPIALTNWVGFRYWRSDRPIVAWILALAIVAEIVGLGLRL